MKIDVDFTTIVEKDHTSVEFALPKSLFKNNAFNSATGILIEFMLVNRIKELRGVGEPNDFPDLGLFIGDDLKLLFEVKTIRDGEKGEAMIYESPTAYKKKRDKIEGETPVRLLIVNWDIVDDKENFVRLKINRIRLYSLATLFRNEEPKHKKKKVDSFMNQHPTSKLYDSDVTDLTPKETDLEVIE